MPVEIILNESPSKEDMKVIYSGLLEFNTGAYGPPENKQVMLMLRKSDTDQILGGLHAGWVYGWLYISMLLIPEDSRREGF